MKKYIIEAVGTFFLVVTIAFTKNPLAVGAILSAFVYVGSSISGGQYNPAVSLALWRIGKITRDDFLKYVASQFGGAIAATLFIGFMKGTPFLVNPSASFSFIHAFVAEMVFTFALVLVVLETAVSPKTKGNSYFGLAIGITVMAGIMAVGEISGAAFNPAVGIGPLLVNIAAQKVAISSFGLYSFAPALGALGAAWMYSLQNRE